MTGSGGNTRASSRPGPWRHRRHHRRRSERDLREHRQQGIVDENSGDVIEGNYIGTTAGGTTAAGNLLDGIEALSSDATIGPGNVISGNGHYGIELASSLAHNVTVQGNFVGTNASGTAAVPNQFAGVFLNVDAHDNAIGIAGGGNVISGNSGSGVVAVGGTTTGNTVKANFIGTNAAGNRGDRQRDRRRLIDVSSMIIGGTTRRRSGT